VKEIEEGDDRFVSRRELQHRLVALRELLDSREAAYTKALELQAVENQRRLAELNHAHQQAQENWARSLPRETFAGYVEQAEKWREEVNKSISAAQGAIGLLRFLGFVGVLALLMALLRLAGATR